MSFRQEGNVIILGLFSDIDNDLPLSRCLLLNGIILDLNKSYYFIFVNLSRWKWTNEEKSCLSSYFIDPLRSNVQSTNSSLHLRFSFAYFLDRCARGSRASWFTLGNLFPVERCTRGVKTKHARRTRKIEIRLCRISSHLAKLIRTRR